MVGNNGCRPSVSRIAAPLPLLLVLARAGASGSSGGCGGAPPRTSAAKALCLRRRVGGCWSSGAGASGGDSRSVMDTSRERLGKLGSRRDSRRGGWGGLGGLVDW